MRLLSLGSCSAEKAKAGPTPTACRWAIAFRTPAPSLRAAMRSSSSWSGLAPASVDALLVHAAGVEGADLGFDAVFDSIFGGFVLFGGVFEDLVQHVAVAVFHHVEHGEGGAIRGDDGVGQPFAVGVLIEVRIRLDGRVHATGEPGCVSARRIRRKEEDREGEKAKKRTVPEFHGGFSRSGMGGIIIWSEPRPSGSGCTVPAPRRSRPRRPASLLPSARMRLSEKTASGSRIFCFFQPYYP